MNLNNQFIPLCEKFRPTNFDDIVLDPLNKNILKNITMYITADRKKIISCTSMKNGIAISDRIKKVINLLTVFLLK